MLYIIASIVKIPLSFILEEGWFKGFFNAVGITGSS
jgi:hypothetical protein